MAVMVFVPLLTSVLTGGLSRYIVEAYAKGDEWRVTQIASTLSVLLLGESAVVLVLGLSLAWQVDRVLTIEPQQVGDARIMLVMLTCMAAVRLPLLPFRFGLYVRQKFALENVLALGIELLRMGLLFSLLLAVSPRVLWVVVASVSAEMAGVVVTQVISRRLVPALHFSIQAVNWQGARELVSYGTWTFVSAVSDMIYRSSDVIILNKLATALDVACFNLGMLISSQLQSFMMLVSAPLQPALIAMHAGGSRDRLRSAYLRGGRYALWMLLPVVLPLMIFARPLVILYTGQKFEMAAAVLVLLLAVFPIGYCNLMMGKLAVASARIGELTRDKSGEINGIHSIIIFTPGLDPPIDIRLCISRYRDAIKFVQI
jgi:O-antigen/teichoic acid export membrane protein